MNAFVSLMYELKKIGKVLTSKFVGTGPLSYKKKNYQATVSQRLRNTVLNYGRAMIRMVSHRSLTMEAQVNSKASPDGICCGQSDIGTGFSLSTAVLCHHSATALYPYLNHLPLILSNLGK